MSTVSIDLPPERLQQLQELADHLGVTPEALVRASVEALLTRPDASVQRAMDYVLAKNADLYQRLA